MSCLTVRQARLSPCSLGEQVLRLGCFQILHKFGNTWQASEALEGQGHTQGPFLFSRAVAAVATGLFSLCSALAWPFALLWTQG